MQGHRQKVTGCLSYCMPEVTRAPCGAIKNSTAGLDSILHIEPDNIIPDFCLLHECDILRAPVMHEMSRPKETPTSICLCRSRDFPLELAGSANINERAKAKQNKVNMLTKDLFARLIWRDWRSTSWAAAVGGQPGSHTSRTKHMLIRTDDGLFDLPRTAANDSLLVGFNLLTECPVDSSPAST